MLILFTCGDLSFSKENINYNSMLQRFFLFFFIIYSTLCCVIHSARLPLLPKKAFIYSSAKLNLIKKNRRYFKCHPKIVDEKNMDFFCGFIRLLFFYEVICMGRNECFHVAPYWWWNIWFDVCLYRALDSVCAVWLRYQFWWIFVVILSLNI